MFSPGATELIVIGVIILLIFGAKRLPEIGKGLGGAVREFRGIKKELNGEEEIKRVAEKDEGSEEKDKPPTLEGKIAKKALERVPGVKRAMYIKDKVTKVKEVIK
jgi:sec-independent protein translocase protein TatA